MMPKNARRCERQQPVAPPFAVARMEGIVEGDTYVLTHLDGCEIVVFEMILVSETVEESDGSLDEGREEVFVRLQDGSRTGSRCADEEEKKVRRDFVSGWETRVLYWGQIFERPLARTMPCSGAPLAPSFTNRIMVTCPLPSLLPSTPGAAAAAAAARRHHRTEHSDFQMPIARRKEPWMSEDSQ